MNDRISNLSSGRGTFETLEFRNGVRKNDCFPTDKVNASACEVLSKYWRKVVLRAVRRLSLAACAAPYSGIEY